MTEPTTPTKPAWPTLEAITIQQHQIESDSVLWLEYCKAIAQARLPEEMFKLVPEVIWRFRVAGSKLVLMRTPQTERLGSIYVPDRAKQPNECGWVLTVGPCLTFTDEQNIRGRTYQPTSTVPNDFTPLLAVGDLVVVNRHAGQALLTSLLDEGMVHRSQEQEFLLISIADVFGPLVQVKNADWSAVQDNILTPDKRIIV